MESRDGIYNQTTRATLLGIVTDSLLGVAKLAAGIAGHSYALLADAVNSLGDVFTSSVVLFALRVAQRPPDKEHPYGHTRAEAIAGSNVALLVAVSALLIGWQTLQQLPHPNLPPPSWTLWVAGANIVIKEALYHYKVRIGRQAGSTALIANAWDHRSDALCALAVLVGLAIARLGGDPIHWADEAAALVVVVIIVATSIKLYRESAHELLDVQADEAFVRQVKEVAMTVPQVRDVETLWLRKSGLEYFADIHIELDPSLTIAQGHQISHQVKDRIRQSFPLIRDALIHLEPAKEE